MPPSTAARRIRFSRFELDVRTGELLKDGRRVRVPDQSIQILQALLEHAGDVVTREELRDRLWPAGTFVDFDHGLNSAVRRLRDALGDSADRPRFIETLPRRGYRFIGAIEMTAAADAVSGSSPAAEHAASSQPNTADAPAHITLAQPSSRPWWAGVALAIALAGAATIVNDTWSRPTDATAAAWPAMPTRLTFEDGLQTEPSFAPDGEFLAYAANVAGNFDIYTRAVGDGDPVAVTTHPAHDWQPDWSPDGRSIAFRSERNGGGIFVVPAGGGIERGVTDFGYRPQWSPDGRAIVFTRSILSGVADVLYVVSGVGSTPRQLPSGRSGAYGWTPDSRRVVSLSTAESTAHAPFTPLLIDIDTETSAAIDWTIAPDVARHFQDHQIRVQDGEKLKWHVDGRSLFFIGVVRGARNVWRLDVDAAARRVTGGPDRVTALPDASTFGLTRTGDRLAFDNSKRSAQLWSHDLDEAGRVIEGSGRRVSLEAAHAEHPALSTDGGWLASIQTRPGGRQSRALVVREMTTGQEKTIREVQDDEGTMFSPHWSHRATRLSYAFIGIPATGIPEAQLRVFDMASRRDEPLTSMSTSDVDFVGGWSPGDEFIVSAGRRYVDGHDAIALLPVAAAPRAEQAARIVTTIEHGHLQQPSMSPDGRWIAFRAVNVPEISGTQIAVVRTQGGDRSHWITVTSGPLPVDKPRWSPRGDRIYYAADDGAMPNVWSVGFDSASGRVVSDARQETAYTDPAAHLLPNIWALELAMGGDHLVTPVVRPRGGIWLTERGTPPRFPLPRGRR